MNWRQIIKREANEDYFKNIISLVQEDGKRYNIFPECKDIFNAFKLCPFDKVKVVIVAMDPYINKGQAHGLAFSVPVGQDIPPSLKNIFKELNSDLNVAIPSSGDLTTWAERGILLIECCIDGARGAVWHSHAKFGWHIFTDKIISI